MSESGHNEQPGPALTAGGLVRRAREDKGMQVAAVAAAIRVPVRKLEMLEADQWNELPDMAFVRALAQTVCRSLQVDPSPVLALLPKAHGCKLEQLGEGLNTPFRERPGLMRTALWLRLSHPSVWGTALLLGAALLVYVMPSDWLRIPSWPAAQQQSAEESLPGAQAEGLSEKKEKTHDDGVAMGFPMPNLVEAVAPTLASPLDPNLPLQFRVSAPSWVEVIDGQGKVMLGRILQPGEPVALGGTLPFRIKIGNAAATELQFRGKPVDLAKATRENVARLELN